MKFIVEPLLDCYIVNISGLIQYSRPMIWHILDSVFSLGADQVMLASSTTMRNWTMNCQLWFQNPEGTTDYIHHRIMWFDQIYCQTLEQAELVVKRLEQLAVYHALQRDYNHG